MTPMTVEPIKRIKHETKVQDARVAKGGSYRKFQHLIREEYPFLLNIMGSVKNMRILTMGFSTGGVTPFARKRAWTLGIDISYLAIRQLSKAIDEEGLSCNATVTIMNCGKLGLKSEFFDIVLFIGVLHHLNSHEVIIESYRVLKPGGKVLMSEPLGLHPLINLYRLLTPNLRTPFEHPLKQRISGS